MFILVVGLIECNYWLSRRTARLRKDILSTAGGATGVVFIDLFTASVHSRQEKMIIKKTDYARVNFRNRSVEKALQTIEHGI